jgi:hypothetical protein
LNSLSLHPLLFPQRKFSYHPIAGFIAQPRNTQKLSPYVFGNRVECPGGWDVGWAGAVIEDVRDR